MEGLFDFLAKNYVIFAIVSVVLIFAIIGFIKKIKKAKAEGVQTADAFAQPLVADDNSAPVQEEVHPEVAAPAPVEPQPEKKEELEIAPSLEGLDSSADLENANAPMIQKADNTLVLDPNASATALDVNANTPELPPEEPAEAPMLIIEDPSAKKEEATPETPATPKTPAAPTEENK